MSANGQAVAPSPADELKDRLDDPAVAAALNSLLDHADLLAILVTGLDGFVRRGEQISDSLSSTVGELRAAAESSEKDLPSLDVKALMSTLSSLASALSDAAPAIETLLRSPMIEPQAVEVLGQLGQALVEGKAAAAADPAGPKGVFGLWRITKDKDVNRGLGFLVHVARAFGRQLPR